MENPVNNRTNHVLRLQAFDALVRLRRDDSTRKSLINKIHTGFGIPIGTLYDWYQGKSSPHGRKGELNYNKELFYVLGALLGDGCVYNWKTTNNYVILVGDKRFADKYATMASKCSSKTKAYIDRSKDIWFVRSNNFRLYELFKKVRTDLGYLKLLIKQSERNSSLLFIEGFFDAEGCVKIIKEKVRKTPKICLDITNTNKDLLDLVKELLKETMGISANYSIQKPRGNRKLAYHLRIYKKEFVKRFFENISTTKLKEEKINYLNNWLNR